MTAVLLFIQMCISRSFLFVTEIMTYSAIFQGTMAEKKRDVSPITQCTKLCMDVQFDPYAELNCM